MNVHGWALDYSPVFTFKTSTRPEAPASAITELSNLNIKVSWSAPFDNYEEISAYRVLIAN